MSKTVAKAIAAIGSGGLTSAVLWLIALTGFNLASEVGVAVVAAVGAASTWLVAKAVAAQGPAVPSVP